MKRMVCLFAAMLLCLGLISPAYATGSVFVPSVTYKETPPVQDAVLNIPVDVIEKLPEDYHVDMEKLEKVIEDEHLKEKLETCVVVTSIQQAKEKTTDIFQESRDLLLDLYEQIAESSQLVMDQKEPEQSQPDQTQPGQTQPDQTVTEPEETEEATAENMMLVFHGEEYVIREMVDVSLRMSGCVEQVHLHDEVLEIEETTISVDFDLGVAPDVKVVVLTYRDGKWSEVKKVTNNGDGTITCVFEHFCPVIFCVPAATLEQPPEAPAVPEAPQVPDYPLVPLILLILAFVLFLLLIFLRQKRKKEEENT